MNRYEQRQWQVKEYPFYAEQMPHTETIFTIGNGLVGTRGSFEEGYPGDNSTTLAAGIFNHKAGELVPELVSIPNWLTLKISVNNEPFRLDSGRILGYERVLDMKTAILRRGVLWQSHDGTILRLAFERFASLDNPHLLALQVLIQVLSDGTHTIEVYSALDGSVKNPPDINHWDTMDGEANADNLYFYGVTDQSGYHVAMQSRCVVEGKDVAWSDASEMPTIAHRTNFQVSANEKVLVTKYVTLHTSRNGDDPVSDCDIALKRSLSAGYDSVKAAHVAVWADYWQKMDIRIEGDEVAQHAVRFCTYHVLIAAPTHEERVSIGAKTLSGFGYKGHIFWDTELFIVPPLTLSHPELARNLLMYRYHNLPGARAKAADSGYEGAMYPWESTDTGMETTPQWTQPHPVTGERIRIWTGDNEQHISSDIAYAVLQFWRWTGDDRWLVDYGAEIVLDTAKFWGSRAEYNAGEDRYELRMQIGPDEYHENIDNSVFTNRIVAWHLGQATALWEWLNANYPDDARRLGEALDLSDERLSLWDDIADRLWIPIKQGVFEQFENFFERLEPINLKDYTPRTINMDKILTHEKTQRTRVIKQADVVMLMALLGRQLGDDDFLMRNWDVYSKVVDHGSSLSPAMHAWVAARLGLTDAAYDHFIYGATLDLEDHKGNVRDGIHAACCGGVWEAVVFGFCGLELTPDGPITDPNLPAHWRRVTFNVVYKGQPILISVP